MAKYEFCKYPDVISMIEAVVKDYWLTQSSCWNIFGTRINTNEHKLSEYEKKKGNTTWY